MAEPTLSPAGPASGLLLGRIGRVPVSVGWSYLGLGLLLISCAWALQQRQGNDDLVLLAIGVWGSVGLVGLIQEVARAFTAKLLGGRVCKASIEAHGGAGHYETATGPQQCLVAASGPATGFLVAIVLAALTAEAEVPFRWLINPLRLPYLEGTWHLVSVASVVIWIAIMLSIVQLLPMSRCDGRAILDGLIATLQPRTRQLDRTLIVARISNCLSFAVLIMAMISAMVERPAGIPRWPFIAAVAVVLWLTGDRLDPRYTTVYDGQPRIGWWGAIRIRRARHQERREAMDVAQLDEILERLHVTGMDSLSTNERALLERVSRQMKQHRASTGHDDR